MRGHRHATGEITKDIDHTRAKKAFARKLIWVLMIRRAVLWITIWLFAYGVGILVARGLGLQQVPLSTIGILGLVVAGIGAAVFQVRRLPTASAIRAAYDHLNSCGGIIMAEEAGDTTVWQTRVPSRVPSLRWHATRNLILLCLAIGFATTSLLLPVRYIKFGAKQPLEIGQLIQELKMEVDTLKEEKLIQEEKAIELLNQLSKLQNESSGFDPYKTWEALDHLKQSTSDLARQAAEEALAKLDTLATVESLAMALQKAMEDGSLAPEITSSIAHVFTAMLDSGKLSEGFFTNLSLLNLQFTSNALSTADLKSLLNGIQCTRCNISNAVARLADAKLIDAKTLAQCQKACLSTKTNLDNLLAYLCQNTNGCDQNLALLLLTGGVDRGPGNAPMIWGEESPEQGAKFKEIALPTSGRIETAQFIGVSIGPPVEIQPEENSFYYWRHTDRSRNIRSHSSCFDDPSST